MVGNKPIQALADGRGAWHALVRPQRQPPSGKRQCFEHRERALDDSPVRLDELDGTSTAFARQFGEALSEGGILKRPVLHDVAGPGAPSRDPIPAEPAIAIENEHGCGGRRTDARGISHVSVVPEFGPDRIVSRRSLPKQTTGLVGRLAVIIAFAERDRDLKVFAGRGWAPFRRFTTADR